METITIQSRMSHFRLLSKVTACSDEHIEGEAMFRGDPLFAGLEVQAQAAAMHVRYRAKFDRHAFLLTVRQCNMPSVAMLSGRYTVQAELHHRSGEAFSYHVKTDGPCGEHFDGELLIGTRSFNDRFQREVLIAHYKQIWAQLRET